MSKKEKSATKVCRHCQSEIPAKAKVCPQCRKKVKGGCLKWVVILIAVVIAISAMGGGDSGSNEPVKVGSVEQTAGTNPVQAEETLSAQTRFYVGDILMDGDMKIVYMSSGEYREENSYSQPEAGYKYIYLQFAFENTSQTSDHSISLYSFEGYADGYAAEMYYGGEEDLSATLSAGRMTTGYIYFTVPEDAAEIEIEYTPNMFLNDKLTFVYEGEKDSGYVPAANTDATPGAYQVGDIVESDKMRITYISCAEYTDVYMKPRDGYRFVTCELEFENLGDSDQYISSYDFDCYADGTSCDARYMRDDDLSATLSTGRKAKGTVTFEVPVDAAVIEMEYVSNYWTSERVVFTVG